MNIKVINLIILLFLSIPTHAMEKRGCRLISDTQITEAYELSIRRSFESVFYIFTLCKISNNTDGAIVLEILPFPQEMEILKLSSLQETPYLEKRILDATYKQEKWIVGIKASDVHDYLEFFGEVSESKIMDRTHGLDGSTWCYKSIKTDEHCFWSPGFKSEERSMSSLYEFGKKHWLQFSNALENNRFY